MPLSRSQAKLFFWAKSDPKGATRRFGDKGADMSKLADYYRKRHHSALSDVMKKDGPGEVSEEEMDRKKTPGLPWKTFKKKHRVPKQTRKETSTSSRTAAELEGLKQGGCFTSTAAVPPSGPGIFGRRRKRKTREPRMELKLVNSKTQAALDEFEMVQWGGYGGGQAPQAPQQSAPPPQGGYGGGQMGGGRPQFDPRFKRRPRPQFGQGGPPQRGGGFRPPQEGGNRFSGY